MASGLQTGNERTYAKATLDSVQTLRCSLWTHVQQQLATITGMALDEVLIGGATAMDVGGLVKPEVNDALFSDTLAADDAGFVNAASVPAPEDASESLVALAASGLELLNQEKLLSLFSEQL